MSQTAHSGYLSNHPQRHERSPRRRAGLSDHLRGLQAAPRLNRRKRQVDTICPDARVNPFFLLAQVGMHAQRIGKRASRLQAWSEVFEATFLI